LRKNILGSPDSGSSVPGGGSKIYFQNIAQHNKKSVIFAV